ncbi:MAG: signal recognition particle-docking protein FtsY [Acidimicrobiales bacterium]|nr:signal recognition particle-docking protein FtsY [Acidimicrobiales bacterium]
MDPVVILFVLALVAAVVAVALVAPRVRRSGGPELEPPATGGRTATLDRPATPPAEADATVAPDEAVPTEVAPPETVPPETVPPVRPTFRDRLAKARGTMAGYLGSVLSRSGVDAETWEDLEEALIRADVGVGSATALLDAVRARAKEEGVDTSEGVLELLKAETKARLAVADRTLHHEDGRTNVWLFVGVNGVGKTTTIGKIGKRESELGRTIVMAAGDTFRAAAAEQLTTWAERCGATIVRGAEGADPGSIIFDGITKAAAIDADLVLADTAGRLHNKTNLMEELRKVRRVADRDPGHVSETLLVIDATTGQNGLAQARVFTEAVEVTGVVLTKLDGSAKGGIVLAIQEELDIPVKLVGLGETADDLVAFDPDEFVDALFATD